MRLVTADELNNQPEGYKDLATILGDDGLICFPAESHYRLGASALSEKAVGTLMAAKRRSAHAPALVFVADAAMLAGVAAPLNDLAKALAHEFWPGPLTLLVEPGDLFPPKVRRALTKATGWIGVRIPGNEVARRIVETFGQPILVSSANLSRKGGAASPAQIRKNFGRHLEAMVDSGDLPQGSPSTLVEVGPAGYSIRRQGAVGVADIERVAAAL